jgi:hypothetical protein
VRNKGEKPNTSGELHEPIVSKDEFQRVQALMELRRAQTADTVSSALLKKTPMRKLRNPVPQKNRQRKGLLDLPEA